MDSLSRSFSHSIQFWLFFLASGLCICELDTIWCRALCLSVHLPLISFLLNSETCGGLGQAGKPPSNCQTTHECAVPWEIFQCLWNVQATPHFLLKCCLYEIYSKLMLRCFSVGKLQRFECKVHGVLMRHIIETEVNSSSPARLRSYRCQKRTPTRHSRPVQA